MDALQELQELLKAKTIPKPKSPSIKLPPAAAPGTGKPGYHKHDGYPLHPIAVKNHPAYFAGKGSQPAEEPKAEEQSKETSAPEFKENQPQIKDIMSKWGSSIMGNNSALEEAGFTPEEANALAKKHFESPTSSDMWGDNELIDAVTKKYGETAALKQKASEITEKYGIGQLNDEEMKEQFEFTQGELDALDCPKTSKEEFINAVYQKLKEKTNQPAKQKARTEEELAEFIDDIWGLSTIQGKEKLVDLGLSEPEANSIWFTHPIEDALAKLKQYLSDHAKESAGEEAKTEKKLHMIPEEIDDAVSDIIDTTNQDDIMKKLIALGYTPDEAGDVYQKVHDSGLEYSEVLHGLLTEKFGEQRKAKGSAGYPNMSEKEIMDFVSTIENANIDDGKTMLESKGFSKQEADDLMKQYMKEYSKDPQGAFNMLADSIHSKVNAMPGDVPEADTDDIINLVADLLMNQESAVEKLVATGAMNEETAKAMMKTALQISGEDEAAIWLNDQITSKLKAKKMEQSHAPNIKDIAEKWKNSTHDAGIQQLVDLGFQKDDAEAVYQHYTKPEASPQEADQYLYDEIANHLKVNAPKATIDENASLIVIDGAITPLSKIMGVLMNNKNTGNYGASLASACGGSKWYAILGNIESVSGEDLLAELGLLNISFSQAVKQGMIDPEEVKQNIVDYYKDGKSPKPLTWKSQGQTKATIDPLDNATIVKIDEVQNLSLGDLMAILENDKNAGSYTSALKKLTGVDINQLHKILGWSGKTKSLSSFLVDNKKTYNQAVEEGLVDPDVVKQAFLDYFNGGKKTTPFSKWKSKVKQTTNIKIEQIPSMMLSSGKEITVEDIKKILENKQNTNKFSQTFTDEFDCSHQEKEALMDSVYAIFYDKYHADKPEGAANFDKAVSETLEKIGEYIKSHSTGKKNVEKIAPFTSYDGNPITFDDIEKILSNPEYAGSYFGTLSSKLHLNEKDYEAIKKIMNPEIMSDKLGHPDKSIHDKATAEIIKKLKKEYGPESKLAAEPKVTWSLKDAAGKMVDPAQILSILKDPEKAGAYKQAWKNIGIGKETANELFDALESAYFDVAGNEYDEYSVSKNAEAIFKKLFEKYGGSGTLKTEESAVASGSSWSLKSKNGETIDPAKILSILENSYNAGSYKKALLEIGVSETDTDEFYYKLKNAFEKVTGVSYNQNKVAGNAQEIFDALYQEYGGKTSAPIEEPITPIKVETPVEEQPASFWEQQYEKVGEQKGSNQGGLYKDKTTGKQYYIKQPEDADWAKSETLANALYKMAGVGTPTAALINWGKGTAIRSEWIEGAEKTTVDKMGKSDDVLNGFLADAWLANWDVVGMEDDNIVYDPKSKKYYRIDAGGALEYRAKGKKKDFGAEAKEFDSLRNSSTNPKSAAVFKNLKKEHLQKGIKQLESVSNNDVLDMVRSVYGNTAHANDLAAILFHRRKDVIEKAKAELQKKPVSETPKKVESGPGKPCAPGMHKHIGYMDPHSINDVHPESSIAHKPNPHDQIQKNEKYKKHYEAVIDAFASATISKNNRDENDNLAQDLASKLGIGPATKKIRSSLHSWQSGSVDGQIAIRAAIAELKGEADDQYAVENAYYLSEKGTHAETFEKAFENGKKNAVGLIPYMALTQRWLKDKYPSGDIPELYRGFAGDVAKKIKSAYHNTAENENALIAIPNDGSSGFTDRKDTASSFASGGVVVMKQNMPIDQVWIRFNCFSGAYKEESEFIVNNKATQIFEKREILVK